MGNVVNWEYNSMGSVFVNVKSGVDKAINIIDKETAHETVHGDATTIPGIPKWKVKLRPTTNPRLQTRKGFNGGFPLYW